MTLAKPEDVPQAESEAPLTHQSEQKLATMKQYFEGLPRSAPLTILSDEKWYPYSQYEFRRDGSPYAESAECVSTKPAVPEVLSIDLPTGFEASNLSPSKQQTGAPSSPMNNTGFRAAPTVVDFPSTPKGKSEKKAVASSNLDAAEER